MPGRLLDPDERDLSSLLQALSATEVPFKVQSVLDTNRRFPAPQLIRILEAHFPRRPYDRRDPDLEYEDLMRQAKPVYGNSADGVLNASGFVEQVMRDYAACGWEILHRNFTTHLAEQNARLRRLGDRSGAEEEELDLGRSLASRSLYLLLMISIGAEFDEAFGVSSGSLRNSRSHESAYSGSNGPYA